MGSLDHDTAFSVHCPGCNAVLSFRAREGDSLLCEACGQRLIVSGGRVAWDPQEQGQRRHDVACPRCDRLLAFLGADGDRFECSGCGLHLDVDGGLVTYEPEAAARSKARTAAVHGPLTAREREDVRRRHDELAGSLAPGDVRSALARGERALERLRASRDAGSHREAELLATLVEMLRDWWDEEAAFDWPTAAQVAAALQAVEAQGASGDAAPGREAFLLELCVDAVRPALEGWAKDRGVDLAARGL